MDYDPELNELSKIFYSNYQFIKKLIDGEIIATDNQDLIDDNINNLEHTVRRVSSLDLFSNNEESKELESDHIKYILLPAFLGYLINFKQGDRKNQILIVKEYYEDFLKRCKNYHLIDCLNEALYSNVNPVISPEFSRNEKIRKFKVQKKYDKELEFLETKINNIQNIHDFDYIEDLKHKYYIALIQKFIILITNEMDLLEREYKIIDVTPIHQSKIHEYQKPQQHIDSNILDQIVMTKKVFGKGHPSLPTMTPQEWYDEKVIRDKLEFERLTRSEVDKGTTPVSNSLSDSEDSDEKVKEQRLLDDWKDTHRTGWGNTYNKG